MKKLGIGVAALVVIIGIGIAVLVSQLDRIVKYAVEESGTTVTQVDVTLQEVNVEPREGRAAMSGLTVGNPAGFTAPYSISLGNIAVELDPSTVTEDVIVVREVAIDQPAVTYELIKGNSNLKAIQKNIEQFTGGGSDAGAERQKESTSEGGKKVIIENLHIREGKVTVKADILQDGEKSVTLPSIHLKDIGKNSGGATGAEIAAEILQAINTAAARAVAEMNIAGLKADLESMADAEKEAAKEKFGEKLKGFLGGE